MRANVLLDEGLTPSEIRQIERRLRFEFNTDHRRLLETVQPAGTGWLHCKKDSVEHIRVALDWPLEGLLFDAENNDFWPDGWCPKLASTSDQSRIATEHIETWPTLIPLTGMGTCQRRQRLPAHPYSPAIKAMSSSMAEIFWNTCNTSSGQHNAQPRSTMRTGR